eukprot:CAMPEP_0119134158 /NCGR_PEP_ID=MMETSP1310-20130426/15849_1 /TAXON_ID=464262 /ORGANISM="Genus nov. species nov., Strain RCC2339" /LENGTH=113 /DNA_ID=CAMNT_0007124913 /DNA_START=511 /DNA_END=850 /DNA_ORIENTATION=-
MSEYLFQGSPETFRVKFLTTSVARSGEGERGSGLLVDRLPLRPLGLALRLSGLYEGERRPRGDAESWLEERARLRRGEGVRDGEWEERGERDKFLPPRLPDDSGEVLIFFLPL